MHEPPDLAQRFADLAALGFEKVESVPLELQVTPLAGGRWRTVHTRPAMGTRVSICTVSRSADQGDTAVGRAFEEIDRLIAVFSHFDSRSAASELNETGQLDGPPPELVGVAADAMSYHRMTAGGFDISVAPVVELFRDRPDGSVPDETEVHEALGLVGARHVEVSKRRIRFRRSGMRVTLDGIAKGSIVDAAALVLERHGIGDYLVEAGGDIRANGSRGDGHPWRIGIQDPDKGPGLPDAIELINGAVATSGSYEKFFDAEGEHHHIVSSATGKSPQFSRSVTVVAPTAQAADALATSVFLAAPESGMRLIEGLPGCECLAIDRSGAQTKTRGWPGVTSIVNGRKVGA